MENNVNDRGHRMISNQNDNNRPRENYKKKKERSSKQKKRLKNVSDTLRLNKIDKTKNVDNRRVVEEGGDRGQWFSRGVDDRIGAAAGSVSFITYY